MESHPAVGGSPWKDWPEDMFAYILLMHLVRCTNLGQSENWRLSALDFDLFLLDSVDQLISYVKFSWAMVK